MAKLGFIGLGNMGLPMARNLAKAGHELAGFDVVPAAREAAQAAGIRVVDQAADAVAGAEIVLTMLPNGKLVLRVYEEILPHARPGTLLIDSSTIDVVSARAAHQAATSSGCRAMDAPVSGGVGGAAAGTLTFIAGGDAADFAAAGPVLALMGKKIVHCGPAGAGQAAKICNNMILGISMIGVCEAFVLAEKLGLDAQALYDVASTSSGQCWSLTSYCPVPGPVPASPANNGYKPGFAAALMLKDLALSQDAAANAGAQTPLGAHAAEIYRAFVEAGHANEDFSGIINAIRNASPHMPGG
jgi:3-hydroxyisobutyrate dehydrogenase